MVDVRYAGFLSVLMLGCSAAATPAKTPACPDAAANVTAAATVEILPPEVDQAPPVPVGVETFAGPEVRSVASTAVRSSPVPDAARAMSMKRWLMSMPWTAMPRRASSWA